MVNVTCKRFFLAFSLIFCLLITSTATVLAVPTGDISDEASNAAENKYFVDLVATVPAGFQGRVSVLLYHESGEYYTVICDHLTGYKGTAEIPKGEYLVEKAYTSEDALVYEAFLSTEEFVLGNVVQTLEVTVKENNATLLPDSNQAQDSEGDTVSDTTTDETAGDASDVPAGDVVADPEDSVQTDEPVKEEAPDDSPAPENGFWAIAKSLLLFLVGSAVFAGIVFAIVYFVRRKYS